MAASPYSTIQDLVDALSEPTYIALFDDATLGDRASIDGSSAVALVRKRAHAQVASRIAGVYEVVPAEQPLDDQVSDLLRDAELAFAVVYAYRRHPEYVRTYGAGPNGDLWEEALDSVERIKSAVNRIPKNDNPPAPKPSNVGGLVVSSGPTMTLGCNGNGF